jgi:type I restriction enzyme S subunit
MLNNWKIYRLSEVSELITKGTTPSTYGYKFIDEGVNYMKSDSTSYDGKLDSSVFVKISEEAHEKLKRSQLQEDDILFSIAGAYLGKSGMVKKEHLPANTNQANAIIRVDEKIALPKFINLLLRNPTLIHYVNASSGQSAQPNLNLTDLGNLELNIPDLKEQTQIANILSAIDDKIENNLATNKTLEDMAMALYKHWFLDFGPFQDGVFVDSELGKIPKGWEVKPLGDFINIVNGYAFKGKDFIEEGVPVLKIKNVKAGKILLHKLSYVSRDNIKKALRVKINFRDILITMTGNRMAGSVDTWVGKVAMFLNKDEYYLNQRVSKLEFSEDYEFLRNYFSIMLSSDKFQFYFINNSTSSGGQANISPDLIKSTDVIIPPKSKLLEFDKVIKGFFNQIFENQEQVQSLTELRDTLLPKLISCEVRLKEFSEEVETIL